MDEKSPRRPQTPKRTGQNTIRRDQNEDEILLMKLYEQQLDDQLRPQDDPSIGLFAKRDMLSRRAPTPKKEEHGPHAIIADKSVEKAVKKIHKQLHPQDHSFKGIFGAKRDKSPKRPVTPKDEQAARNAVILNEKTKEAVHKHLVATDPFYGPDAPRPSEEIGEAKPKKGQVSPKSPRPQPGPMFPTEEAAKAIEVTKKNDPKYTVQEALLTAHKVGQVAVPAADTAEPRIKEEQPHPKAFEKLIRTFSFKKKRQPKESEELVSDFSTTDTSVHLSTTDTSVHLSTTDTSVHTSHLSTTDPISVHTSHLSTSLASELFEDNVSEAWTPSTTDPASDARLAPLSEEGDSLSDSFPSEADEGAVGGEETETFAEQGQDPSTASGRFRPIKVAVENPEDIPSRDEGRSSKYSVYHCEDVEESGSEDYYQDSRGRFPRRMHERRDDDDSPPPGGSSRRFEALRFGGCIGPFHDETSLWFNDKNLEVRSSDREGGKERKGGRDPVKMNPVKKGVMETPDGVYDFLYRMKPNNQIAVLRTVPRSASGKEVKSPRGTKHSEELSRQIQADKQRFLSTIKKADRSSSSEDSVPESQSSTPRTPSSRRHAAGSPTGASWNRQSRSMSSSDSDVSSDSDPEMDY